MSEIEFNLTPPTEVERPEAAAKGGKAASGVSFERDLGRAIEAVDQLQLDADAEASKVAQGAGNLHEVALALEKADVAMRLAMKVRNKVVDTYNEIMRMSV